MDKVMKLHGHYINEEDGKLFVDGEDTPMPIEFILNRYGITAGILVDFFYPTMTPASDGDGYFIRMTVGNPTRIFYRGLLNKEYRIIFVRNRYEIGLTNEGGFPYIPITDKNHETKLFFHYHDAEQWLIDNKEQLDSHDLPKTFLEECNDDK
jgi:hypothetical protein